MGDSNVVIGSRSGYSRIHTRNNERTPQETVEIYLEGELVDTINIRTLTRFSGVAQEQFPKPETAAVSTNNNAQTSGSAEASSSSADVQNGPVIADGSGANDNPTVAEEQAVPEKKRFDVRVPRAWIQPGLGPVRYMITWMKTNQTRRNNVPLDNILPHAAERVSFKGLVDTYITAFAFDLRPGFLTQDVKKAILDRLTAVPAQAEDTQYLYERMPEKDSTVARMITAYHEHLEADRYDEEQVQAIVEYVKNVDDEGALRKQLESVRRSRDKKVHQERMHHQHESLRQGFEAFAGPAQQRAILQRTATLEDYAAPRRAPYDGAGRQNNGRRRPRREQQREGRERAAGIDMVERAVSALNVQDRAAPSTPAAASAEGRAAFDAA